VAVALAPAIAILLLSSLLAGGTGGLLTAAAPCPDGEDCAPPAVAVAGASLVCTSGGACGASRDAPLLAEDAAPPDVAGRAVAVIEEPCGALLFGNDPYRRSPPASLTKIVTALVAAERADLSETVSVQVDGAELALSTDSTVMGLQPGQQLLMRDLLYGLLLPSGNDAALAIADHVAASIPDFVELMNSKVEELGLNDTNFTNPHGLDDPALYTSAFDAAMLGRELLRQPELAAIVQTDSYQPAWDGPPIWNSNRLLQLYPDSLGVKIGYTDKAGQTIVAAAERDGRRLIVSVLGSADIYQDAIALFDWAFTSTASTC
jgi:D-alanyl-D-alanine carboxypeptidase